MDDSQVIYMGNWENTFGGLGGLHRSRDRKKSWETLPLPVEPNGTIWDLSTHPADSNFLLASTVNGEIFYSPDAGNSWTKVQRKFGEIHALAWVPS